MSEIEPFKIRDIEINPPLVLSPMAGVTDISFRRLLKQRGGVGLTVSEFISVEGLTRNNPKSKRQMRFYENERNSPKPAASSTSPCMAAQKNRDIEAWQIGIWFAKSRKRSAFLFRAAAMSRRSNRHSSVFVKAVAMES